MVNVAKFISSALAIQEYANYISIVLFSIAVLDYPINLYSVYKQSTSISVFNLKE